MGVHPLSRRHRFSHSLSNRSIQVKRFSETATTKRSALQRGAMRTFNAIDGIAPLLPIGFLLFGIGWMGEASDWTSRFWAGVVIVGAVFALHEILGSR
jgi:hypothetical protein